MVLILVSFKESSVLEHAPAIPHFWSALESFLHILIIKSLLGKKEILLGMYTSILFGCGIFRNTGKKL